MYLDIMVIDLAAVMPWQSFDHVKAVIMKEVEGRPKEF